MTLEMLFLCKGAPAVGAMLLFLFCARAGVVVWHDACCWSTSSILFVPGLVENTGPFGHPFNVQGQCLNARTITSSRVTNDFTDP